MKEENYWKEFEHSGKVEDYLNYRSCLKEDGDSEKMQGEEKNHAGLFLRDRNHTEDDSGGRIR